MTTAAGSQIVTFRVANDLFAADIASVERVLRYSAPAAVPSLPDWLEGVIEYRGRVVPVIDLRKRFELPPQAALAETRILVFTAAGQWIAAVVDAVVEVAAVREPELAPPPPLFRGLSAEYLRGIARRDGRLVILLDIDRLLSSTERLVLEQAVAGVEADRGRNGGATRGRH